MDEFKEQEFYVVATTTNPVQAYLDVDLTKGFTHVAVTSACIPKTYYVLPTDATLTINEGTGPITVTMLAGNYSVNSFPSIFQTKVTATARIDFTYRATFPVSATQVQTSKFTFTVSGNGAVQPTFTINDLYLARVMGFTKGTTYSFAGNTLVSANVVNFQSYDEILLVSDMVENQRNLLQEIYSSANLYNSSIVWSNASLPLNAKKLAPTSSNNFTFALVTEENDLIQLNGSEWSFVLMFFRVSDYEQVVKKFIAVKLMEAQNKELM